MSDYKIIVQGYPLYLVRVTRALDADVVPIIGWRDYGEAEGLLDPIVASGHGAENAEGISDGVYTVVVDRTAVNAVSTAIKEGIDFWQEMAKDA